MKRRPPSLRRAIAEAWILPVGIAAGFIGVALLLGGSPLDMTYDQPEATTAPAVSAPAPGSPAALIAKHDCWTGDAPADMQGKLPGAVVVTLPGHDAPTYGGTRLVGQALEQVFNGADHGLVVHAFCRGGDHR